MVISGELDLLSTPSLAGHLNQILAGGPRHLVFDLARVSFIDCAAARLIAGTEAFLPDDRRPASAAPPRRPAASWSSPAWTFAARWEDGRHRGTRPAGRRGPAPRTGRAMKAQ